MPVGYLVSVLLVAVGTFFALVAPRRPRPLGAMSFLFGMVVNELPFLALYWLTAATLLAAGEGDLHTAAGRVVLAVAILSAVGLAWVLRRAVRARGVVGRALRRGLGPTWSSAVGTEGATRGRRRTALPRILLAPFWARRREIERIANVRYGDAGPGNLLDVYRRRSGTSGGPVFIHLHGGRFRHGTKSREARPLLYQLACDGWVCVSANYRLGADISWSDQMVDVKRVIGWARSHAARYGADAQSVLIGGSSAGAHLAATAALTPGFVAFQPGFEGIDTAVMGAVCLYGYYGAAEDGGRHPSSPLDYVSAAAPPFFVAHGDRDTYTSVDQAQLFVARLQHASRRPVVYAELPGAQHAFDLFHSVRFEAVAEGIEAFATWLCSAGPVPRSAP